MTATVHTIETRVHGRYLVESPGAGPAPMLVGFHGYGELAEHMLDVLRRMAGGEWLLVSIQALNRFYTRRNDVVASWMTRQDRELAMADNTAYVSAVLAAVQHDYRVGQPVVFTGFSQGVAMAYRTAVAARRQGHRCDGLIVLAGDVPPDVAPDAPALPPVLLGRGTGDEWYTAEKAARDVALLRAAGVAVSEHVFEAGHVWDESFLARARAFLDASGPRTP